MSQHKAVLVPALCLLLAGCLGGSSGDGDNGRNEATSNEPLNERGTAPGFRELTPFTLEDSVASRERALSANLAGQATRVMTGNPGMLEASLAVQAVVLTPSDVDRPRTVTVALLNEAGERLGEFRVNLVNTDGVPIRERAGAWLNARKRVLTLAEDCAIAEVAAGAAYVRQDQGYADYAALRAEWGLPFTGDAPVLTEAYSGLASALDQYRRGAINAASLEQAVDAVAHAARSHQDAHGNGPVNEAYDPLPLQSPPERNLHYDAASGRVSSIIGNTRLGTRNGSRWRLDASWAHLAGVMGSGQLPECEGRR